MFFRLLLLAGSLLIFGVAESCAQDEAPPPPPGTSAISVHARIVGVTALVRDKHGDLVRGLDKSAFELREDGKLQPIRYFDFDNDLPLSIALMIDTSGSQKPYFTEEQQASEAFLTSMLTRPQDKASVVRFDDDVLLLQNSTSDLAKLRAALDKFAMPHKPRPGTHGGTLLYDAIAATAQIITGKQSGRRAIIVLTDGEDRGSNATLEQAIQLAQMADTVVYTILYSRDDPGHVTLPSPTWHSSHPSGRSIMEEISAATGGRVFAVHKDTPVTRIYQQIEEEMRMQYRLGYTPPSSKPLQYHAIQLTTRDHSLNVQARTGYYTPQ